MNRKTVSKIVAVVALAFLVAGLVLTIYDLDFPCGASQFRHDIILTTAAFVVGIIFEMVTGLFAKAECKIPHYEHQ